MTKPAMVNASQVTSLTKELPICGSGSANNGTGVVDGTPVDFGKKGAADLWTESRAT